MTDPTITDADREALDDIGAPYASWAEFCRRSDYDAALKAVADFRHAHTAPLEARVQELEHIAKDLLQHVDWLTSGLPDMLERAALTDEEGLIGAATDAAESARKALEGRGS